MQKITPCLWFDDNAEEAVNFYLSIFRNASIKHITHYGEAGYDIHHHPAGSVMTIEFELEGMCYTALNGGPMFKLNEAVSFQISCDSQQEVDYYWEKLTAGGDETAQQCGWLKDRFGLSWQIVPRALIQLLQDSDSAKTERVMNALLQMKKLDIAALQKAGDG